MVTFEKDRFIIIVNGSNATETWTDMVDDLLDLLYSKDENFTRQHRSVILLLQHMMLSWEQVKSLKK